MGNLVKINNNVQKRHISDRRGVEGEDMRLERSGVASYPPPPSLHSFGSIKSTGLLPTEKQESFISPNPRERIGMVRRHVGSGIRPPGSEVQLYYFSHEFTGLLFIQQLPLEYSLCYRDFSNTWNTTKLIKLL